MKRAIFLVAAVAFIAAVAFLGRGVLCSSASREAIANNEKVRKPAVADMFYPGDAEKLRAMVVDSLKAATKEDFQNPIKAILAPHAGYIYCGGTLAAAYKQIEGPAFRYHTVILIGPSHRYATKAAAVSSADRWETPVGTVLVDTDLTRKLTEMGARIQFDDRAHVAEHCLEVQLPYLIVAAGGKPFRIVPLLTNSSDPLDHEIVARALAEVAKDAGTLIVLSSDLSHYPRASVAEDVDRQILSGLTSLDAKTLRAANEKILESRPAGLSTTMCGLEAALCLTRAAPLLGITESKVVQYTHSGMAGGDRQRVVGYAAAVFTGDGKSASAEAVPPLTLIFSSQSRKELISLARLAVQEATAGNWVSYDPSHNPELQVKAGCFVTLKNQGRLRGCIGCFQTDEPLWKTVREMAVSSATMDARFRHDPITTAEMPQLDVEISVLSPLRPITRPLEELKLGRDGIVIQDRGRSGTFLPQVAQQTGWSLEEFLGHCAHDKAGIGWDGWKSPTARVFAYTATIVSEKEFTGSGHE